MLRMGRGSKSEPAEEHLGNVPQPPVITTPSALAAISSEKVFAEQLPAGESAAGRAGGATTEHENLARAIKDGVVGGFVGNTTALTGEATFKGMLRVDGRLAGRVNSEKGTLIVSSGGQMDAEINVAVAKINGTINGDINTTERLELGRTARVVGNIQTPELIIEQGAIFEGSCHMTQRAAAAPVSMPTRAALAPEVANGKPPATAVPAVAMSAATERANSSATPPGGSKVADMQGTNVTV